MRWLQIKSLIASKPLQGLYAALFIIPAIANVMLLGEDVIALYIGAVAFAVGSVLYASRRPEMVAVGTPQEARNNGWTTTSLVEALEDADQSIADVQEPQAQAQLNTPAAVQEIDSRTFRSVLLTINKSRPIARYFASFFIVIALGCLLVANSYRFMGVFHATTNRHGKGTIMRLDQLYISGMRYGQPIELTHDVGSNQPPETSNGVLLGIDADGTVTIQLEDGKILRIPGSRVYAIAQEEG